MAQKIEVKQKDRNAQYEFLVKDVRNNWFHFKLMKDESGTVHVKTIDEEATCYFSWMSGGTIGGDIDIYLSDPIPVMVFPNNKMNGSHLEIDIKGKWIYYGYDISMTKDPNRRLKMEMIN